ncbi:hypothetical protein I6N95_17155 [Vagococcus sp. BWB3-3]|uniref:Uncharacterized protein n=1 Tax=Vagococcus allomyrinae TaxID=2794353 RepID=A0A940SXV1_9ENTE|nr:hypothetical protein [Vagococcus allomyrinae]MBP1042748.1 hypothetical protein [Vagococcus allomyrinae]
MNLKKQSLIYLLASLGLFMFNYIYSLFSHGVSSDAMSGMWHYTIIMAILSGAMSLLSHNQLKKQIRLAALMINCGVATIVSGHLLTGIVEIAGTNSVYIPYYDYSGWLFILVGTLIGCFRLVIKHPPQSLD